MTRNKLQKFNNFVIFQTDEGKVNIDVLFQNETLWLTQKLLRRRRNKRKFNY